MLLQYQKQTKTALLMGKIPLMLLLPTAFRTLWIYQVLPFNGSLDTSPIEHKIPNQEPYWAVDHEFYYELGI